MFDPDAFETSFDSAFARFNQHFDRYTLGAALDRLFNVYPSLDMYEALQLRKKLGDILVDAFSDIEPLDFEPEHMDILLDTITKKHLSLLPVVSKALALAADGVVKGDLHKIPYLDELAKQPTLSADVTDFIDTSIDKAADLSEICDQLRNTPYVGLIDERIINTYINDVVVNGDMGNVAVALRRLKSIPSVWQVFENNHDVQNYFGAYAPVVSGHDLPADLSDIGLSYNFYYDASEKFIGINFWHSFWDNGTTATEWVESIDDDALPGTYILLNHVLGVLKGTRQGEITTNTNWIDQQKMYLLPAIEGDVLAVIEQMKQLQIPLPAMPATVLPVSHVWSAHQSFKGAAPHP